MNKTQYYNYKKNNAGFSVIEILVTIFILTLVGIAVWTFQKDVFFLNSNISSSLATQQEMRKAFKLLSAEIRSISPSSTGSYPIAEASSTSFTFYSDIDNDGLKERLRYFLDGNTAKKGILKPNGNPLAYNPANETITEIARDVANGAAPIFDYYDTNYDGTTMPLVQPVSVITARLVKITFIIDKNPLRPPAPITMTTQVSMRNLKDNL